MTTTLTGITDTGRLDDLPRSAWEAIIAERVPLGRAGTAQEVAWAAAFLASDQGAWVSGQAWNVDGGQMTVR